MEPDLKTCPHCGTEGILIMSDGRCPHCKKLLLEEDEQLIDVRNDHTEMQANSKYCHVPPDPDKLNMNNLSWYSLGLFMVVTGFAYCITCAIILVITQTSFDEYFLVLAIEFAPIGLVAGYALGREANRWRILRNCLLLSVAALFLIGLLIVIFRLHQFYAAMPIYFTLGFAFLSGVMTFSFGQRSRGVKVAPCLIIPIFSILVYACLEIIRLGKIPSGLYAWGNMVSVMAQIFPSAIVAGACIGIARKPVFASLSAAITIIVLLTVASFLPIPQPLFDCLTIEAGYLSAVVVCLVGSLKKRDVIILAVSGLAWFIPPLHLIPALALLLWALFQRRQESLLEVHRKATEKQASDTPKNYFNSSIQPTQFLSNQATEPSDNLQLCKGCGSLLSQAQREYMLGNPGYQEWCREGYCSFSCFEKYKNQLKTD